jgi:ATP-dependent exoDNAse (exonuclease V) alpha subunit
MADVLNERIHNESLDAHAPTVRGARGHRIGVGDLILTRRNDPTIDLRNPSGSAGQLDSVRNGNRWRVAAIDRAANRVAAERLDDGARTVFENQYLREHVSLGYAVTVHSAQGVTADTTHSVLGENVTRSLLTLR